MDYYRHLYRVMRDNEKVDPDWPALTLAHTFEHGMQTAHALDVGITALGEWARRNAR